MTGPNSPSIVVDTNVLVYATDGKAPQHARSKALRDEIEAGRIVAAVTPQILLEFYATATGKRVAVARSPAIAAAEIEALAETFVVLPVPADFADRVAALARVVAPIGPEIYDLAIAVTALAAGITDIYTYDTSVFGRVPGVTVKAP